MPINGYGDLKSGSFNYDNVCSAIQVDANRLCRIKDIRISTFTDRVNFLINPKAAGAFIDLELEAFRYI